MECYGTTFRNTIISSSAMELSVRTGGFFALAPANSPRGIIDKESVPGTSGKAGSAKSNDLAKVVPGQQQQKQQQQQQQQWYLPLVVRQRKVAVR
jgi:hypothetical protein